MNKKIKKNYLISFISLSIVIAFQMIFFILKSPNPKLMKSVFVITCSSAYISFYLGYMKKNTYWLLSVLILKAATIILCLLQIISLIFSKEISVILSSTTELTGLSPIVFSVIYIIIFALSVNYLYWCYQLIKYYLHLKTGLDG